MLGTLLLLSSLAGVAFGLYMALDPSTREQGVFFILWWIPAAAAAIGIILLDPVTIVIGAFCFIVAGVALAMEHRGSRRPSRGSRSGTRKRPTSEKTDPWLTEAPKNLALWLPQRAKRWLFGSKKTRGRGKTAR